VVALEVSVVRVAAGFTIWSRGCEQSCEEVEVAVGTCGIELRHEDAGASGGSVGIPPEVCPLPERSCCRRRR